MEWKVDVSGAQPTDEVIFEGLDGSFRGVDAVIVGFHKLNGTVAGGDKCFDGGRSLVVGDIECGRKAFGCEVVEDFGEGGNDVVTLCRRYWKGEDVVDVIVVCNEKKLLVVEGACGQVAGTVGVDGALVLVRERCKAEDVGADRRVVEWLSGVLIFGMEPHAALGRGWGLGEVFADGLGVKEWACVEESKMRCTEKGLDWRAGPYSVCV